MKKFLIKFLKHLVVSAGMIFLMMGVGALIVFPFSYAIIAIQNSGKYQFYIWFYIIVASMIALISTIIEPYTKKIDRWIDGENN